jgi:putative restriction endonuclease
MRFWVGVTDNTWFNFQAAKRLDELNFWQPSATPPFKDAPMGMPFLFKLRRPNHHIAGGGFFVAYSRLPVSLAWEVFGEKNGTASYDDLLNLLRPLQGGRPVVEEIGCTILANPFFFSRDQWISDPAGFAHNIVRGKMYESSAGDGQAIWNEVQLKLRYAAEWSADRELPVLQGTREAAKKFGDPILVKPRLGQSSFRVLVTDAYKRRCAMTGESTLVALEAAHIIPYAKEGTHDVRNGLLLRADFHRLFDVGLVSVTPELKIRVSRKIREAWFNGKAYYRLNDQPLSIPDRKEDRPDPDRLDWHFRTMFQA